MGTGEKIESSVYMLFIGIIILAFFFVLVGSTGMALTGAGGCDPNVMSSDGHYSQCTDRALDELDAWLGQGPNAKW